MEVIKKNIPFPQIILEQYILNELSIEESEQIRKACKENKDLNKYIQDLRESSAQILATYPVHLVSTQILDRIDSMKKRNSNKMRIRPLMAGGISLAFFLIFLFVIPDYTGFKSIIFTTNERVKGNASHLSLYLKTEHGHEKLSNEQEVSKGDIIQIGYESMGQKYGVIFSIDGRGCVTLHYPYKVSGDHSLKSQNEHFLNNSYELDDAPDFERFFFVYSNNKIKVSSIIDAAKRMAKSDTAKNGSIVLPSGIKQMSLILKKKVIW